MEMEDQYKNARAAYEKNCKVCIWAIEAGGMPSVTHGGNCGHVIDGIRNVRPHLKASETQPVVHVARATLRPTKHTIAQMDPNPDRPSTSSYPMNAEGLEEFFNFLHRSNVMLMRKKNADYANSEDVFFNLRRGGQYGVVIRMDDKVSRLLNLLKQGASSPQVDESIDDTLRDIGIYSSLCLAMRHEARQKLKADPICPECNEPLAKGDHSSHSEDYE